MNAIRRVRTWIAPGCWVFEYTFSQGGTAHWRRVSEMFVLRTLLDDQRGTHTRVRAAGQLIRDEAPPIALVEGLRLLLELWHFHLDVDEGAVTRAVFRLRHAGSGDVIPQSFVVRDCQCPRVLCQIERLRIDPSEDGLSPVRADSGIRSAGLSKCVASSLV
jgi:hypothetical protein